MNFKYCLLCYLKYVLIFIDTVAKVSDQLAKGEEGRLFAVVHICGKQFKITAEDIIIIEGYWAPHPSDQIILEKVFKNLMLIAVIYAMNLLFK